MWTFQPILESRDFFFYSAPAFPWTVRCVFLCGRFSLCRLFLHSSSIRLSFSPLSPLLPPISSSLPTNFPVFFFSRTLCLEELTWVVRVLVDLVWRSSVADWILSCSENHRLGCSIAHCMCSPRIPWSPSFSLPRSLRWACLSMVVDSLPFPSVVRFDVVRRGNGGDSSSSENPSIRDPTHSEVRVDH